MHGVLVVDKPAGMTSHDVVDAIRKRLATKKVGHGGTLDPDATGVLVVGVGKATRLLALGQARPKRYLAVARFGIVTSTQDASGDILEENVADLDPDAIEAALPAFRGDIQQVPPMVSAVKIAGERLYKKARRGEEVERPPRGVTVYRFDLKSFLPGERPEATFEVECSAGTYVRTLVHDLGRALGCGAHLASLRRTEASGFTEAEAVPLDRVSVRHLRPVADVVSFLPMVEVGEDDARLVGDGRMLRGIVAGDELVGITQGGELLGLYRRTDDGYKAEVVLAR